MTQTVLSNFSYHNLLSKGGYANNPEQSGNKARKVLLTFFVALISYAGMAQTYTTKQDGAWSSASTWVGGVVPSGTIATGVTVNIKHDVTYNLSTDLNVSGTLNITGDTLRFASSFDKNVNINATGVFVITTGGFIQDVYADKSVLKVDGRLMATNAKIMVSKDFNSTPGAKKTFTNTTVQVSGKYTSDGTSASPAIDTIQNSTVQISVNKGGDFEIKDYVTVRVANAKISVSEGNFKTNANATINVLSTATNNYGFDLIKTSKDLDNAATWNARIDAYCVSGSVKGSKASDIDFTRPEDCSTTTTSVAAPELSFTNGVLKSGTAKKEGAVYRFSNITTGVDAEIKMKKFSRSTIVMNNFDNSTLGWNKAFQPEFGLPGLVPANQDWYIDFEMTFYEAGTNKKKKVQRADFTALDVDGDGYSIAEYAMFNNPAGVAYSSFSSLATTPAGSLGTVLNCTVCGVASALSQCLICHGTGDVLGLDCVVCDGSGVLYGGCSHAFEGIIGNILQGPVQNFANIDTAGTAVMATYQYKDVDKITFRYGAKSGAYAVNGSGIRLNSLWSKSFDLTPWQTLPVSFASFSVMLEKGTANLNWQAPASEKLSHFIVQRSTDGVNFSSIATVLPGTTTNYQYKDNAVTSTTGVVYYRVVSVDYTKETQTSTVKLVRLTKNEAQALALTTYPNPVVNDVRITLPNAWQNKPVMLQLYTSAGTVAKTIQLGSAGQTETMTLNGLSKGMYIVKAVCGEETAQQRIVKN